MKDLTAQSESPLAYLLRPGCLVAIVGLVVIVAAIVGYAFHSPGSGDMVESLQNRGGGVKYLVWLVLGVGTTMLGALIAFLDFRRS